MADSIQKIVLELEGRGIDKTQKKMGGFFSKLGGFFSKFRMEFLSFMFAGMQIQRTFQRIATSTVTTFQTVMSSVAGASTNVTRLASHFDYLKFTIGSAIDNALGPLMPTLVAIINKIAEWTEKNPEWVAGIVLGGIALGGVLFVGSQLVLTFNSMVMLLYNLAKAFGVAEGEMLVFYGSLLGTLALVVGLIVATGLLGAKLGSDLVDALLKSEDEWSLYEKILVKTTYLVIDLTEKLDEMIKKLSETTKFPLFKFMIEPITEKLASLMGNFKNILDQAKMIGEIKRGELPLSPSGGNVTINNNYNSTVSGISGDASRQSEEINKIIKKSMEEFTTELLNQMGRYNNTKGG